jgi:hypothetical protein
MSIRLYIRRLSIYHLTVDACIDQEREGDGRSENDIRYTHNARAAVKHHVLGRLQGHLIGGLQVAPWFELDSAQY